MPQGRLHSGSFVDLGLLSCRLFFLALSFAVFLAFLMHLVQLGLEVVARYSIYLRVLRSYLLEQSLV